MSKGGGFSPQITTPDLLYKFDLAKHVALIRSIAIMNPQAYPRSVEILRILLSPYVDTEFTDDLKKIGEDTKLLKLQDIITKSRKEEEIKSANNEYDMRYADLLFESLLFLMDRDDLLLESYVMVDVGEKRKKKDKEEPDESIEEEELEDGEEIDASSIN
jgi:hypothetical protein